MARRRWLPDNVTAFKDKMGRTRYRFRKSGLPQYLFRHDPGTPEFMDEYHRAKNAAAPDAAPRYDPASFHALIDSYYKSTRFARMKPSSQKMRQNAIERWRLKHGDKRVKDLEARHIDKMMGEIAAATPHAANDLRKMLSILMRHAQLLGLRTDNPASVVPPIETDGDGYHCWTEEEIAQYEEKWPLGTRERLAMSLLLYTGLRRSDMVKIGRQHRQGDRFILRHEKNKSDTSIRILPQLGAALDAMEDKHLTYLVTHKGKPFEPASFGNWFRDRCNDAGLPHCSAHGLRKAMSRRLAESGATNLEGRAVTGHKTDAMFAHYAAAANRAKLADEALDKVAGRIGLANPNGKPANKGSKSG